MEKTFTKPILKKAKAGWYIEFYAFNSLTKKVQQVRKKSNLNRIKDIKEREYEASVLVIAYHNQLKAGWSPFDEEANEELRKNTISITIEEAKELFEQHHRDIGTKKKSIQTYASKINYLIQCYPNTKVNKIESKDLNLFFKNVVKVWKDKTGKVIKVDWSDSTYRACKRALTNFFNYLVKEKYITSTPMVQLDKISLTKESEKTHTVFTDEHFEELRNRMLKYDKYAYFFSTFMLNTCARPKEIRLLQLKYIDLDNKKLLIPKHIGKNKKDRLLDIEPQLLSALKALEIEKYPPTYYLTGSTTNIIGSTPVGENTPYNRVINLMKGVKIDKEDKNKKFEDLTAFGYDLYSFKHTSVVRRYTKAKWRTENIMKMCGHSSPSITEIYLKDLGVYIDNTLLEIPEF